MEGFAQVYTAVILRWGM